MEHHNPPLASTRATSATFPLSYSNSPKFPSLSPSPQVDDRQFSPRSPRAPRSPRSPQPSTALHPVEKAHSHKRSKSRELRFPRHMSHLSSASARGLLSTWSSKEKDQDLLKPEGRWVSESPNSRKGSLIENERLGPVRGIQSLSDLQRVKEKRKIGEEYLRSALTSTGTLATDITRRLDYTYYNLLEKITALNSTISSFQDLSESASTLLSDFERETADMDQNIREQINDLHGFTPQTEQATALERRMKAGQRRVEELGKRLESVQHEIDSWEQRETEWQTRTTRRLRIWGIGLGAVVTLVLALILRQNQTDRVSFRDPQQDGWMVWDHVSPVKPGSDAGPTLPSILADRRESLAKAGPGPTPTTYDPLRILDDL